MIPDDPIDFKIAELIDKYLRNDIHAGELRILEEWKAADRANAQLWNKLTDVNYSGSQLRRWPNDAQSEALWLQVQRALQTKPTKTRKSKHTVWYAAAVLAIFGLAGLFVYDGKLPQDAGNQTIRVAGKTLPAAAAAEVGTPAVSNEVTLIMGDGSAVSLGDNPSLFQEEDGTQISKTGGRLTYSTEGRASGLATVLNTVITPVARTYHLMLADGTHVWLNAASSIQYPTAFDGDVRKVILKGEAYFEVAHDPDKPFIVVAEKSHISVLGTRFNVKSYPTDGMDRTALLSGSLRVSSREGTRSELLHPGYEAVVTEGKGMTIQKANAENVLAWKNNLFIFENESLESLMRELAKWYGLNVHFVDNEVKNYHFTGRLERYQDTRFLLDIIAETSKVEFTLSGNQLYVKSAQR